MAAFAFSLLRYNESGGQDKNGIGELPHQREFAVANELVPLQGGGHLEWSGGLDADLSAFGAEHLSYTSQIDGLGAFVAEGDYILDGAAEVVRTPAGEEHPAGADVLREASDRDTF